MGNTASITIRPARDSDALAIARVHVETWRETYPTLLPPDYLAEKLSISRSATNWSRSLRTGGVERILVAESEPTGVIGFAAFGPSRETMFPDDGELYAIYLDVDAQNLGLGRQLCRQVAAEFMKTGQTAMFAEVLEGNPSRFFYEALGAERAAVKEHRFAGELLPTVLYRFSDLGALTSAKLQDG